MKYILTTSLLLFCLISFSQTKNGVHKKKPKNTYAVDAAGGWDADSATGGWVADSTLRKYTAGINDSIYKPSPGGLLIWDQEDTSAQFKTLPLQMPLQYQIGDGPMNDELSTDDLQMMTTAIMLKILENLVEQVHTLEKQVKALQRNSVPRHHKPKGISKKVALY